MVPFTVTTVPFFTEARTLSLFEVSAAERTRTFSAPLTVPPTGWTSVTLLVSSGVEGFGVALGLGVGVAVAASPATTRSERM